MSMPEAGVFAKLSKTTRHPDQNVWLLSLALIHVPLYRDHKISQTVPVTCSKRF